MAAPPQSARDVVTVRVAARAKRYPDVYPQPLRTDGLAARDAALAHAIDQAVSRRWLTLAAVLAAPLKRPWASLDPRVQAALLVGAAQLLLMERLPDHAVINEAVEWTRSNAGVPASRLVNAVLRRTAELRGARHLFPVQGPWWPPSDLEEKGARHLLPLDDGRALRLVEPVFADDPLVRLAQQTSHPVALLERWADRLGRDKAMVLAVHDLARPPIIVAGLSSAAAACEPHEENGFAVFGGDKALLATILREQPAARVQDPASAAPVSATAGLEPGLIVEVCAGRGTKTRQLAEVHPRARIVASDAAADRLATLRGVFAGQDRVQVIDTAGLDRYAGQADLVVVDAPCSNTAVLARRPEARYRFSARTLKRLVAMQRQILADALRLPAPSGRLLYCTCSLEDEENEQQARWLERWHPLVRRSCGRWMPRGLPGDPPTRYTDGGFHVVLQRQGAAGDRERG